MCFASRQAAVVAFISLILLVNAKPFPSLSVKQHLANPQERDTVANHYIAKYHAHVTDEAIESHRRALKTTLEERKKSSELRFTPSIDILHIGSLRALDLRIDDDMIPTIARAPEIHYIEQSVTKTAGAIASTATVQQDGSYGLGRISHTTTGIAKYAHSSPCGEGIYVYVVDSGINVLHEEFGGTSSRAQWGYNAVNNNSIDGFGHGTHVAGIIGSQTYGVAKDVTLIAVKILDEAGHGTTNSFVQGVNWTIQDIQANGRIGKAVINVSIEGHFVQIENDIVDAAVTAGVPVIAAAGNYGNDAGNNSPCSADLALCVGAIDPTNDTMAVWSAYGDKVKVYAPGTNVKSTWISDATSTMTMSGTSMAAPHVAGLAAYLMAKENITDATAVIERITELAKQALVHGARAAQWQTAIQRTDNSGPTLIAWNGECASASYPGCF